MSDHQSWVNQEALRNSKPRVSSCYWLRMRSESQTFRRAIDESKVKLHLAVSRDTWLMPSNILLNTQSTVGYNNSLKKTNKDIELGVKKSTNLEMKPVGVSIRMEAHQRSKGQPLSLRPGRVSITLQIKLTRLQMKFRRRQHRG